MGGKEALWQEGMTRTLPRLTTAEVPVLIVHTIPQFSAFLLSECPAVVVYVDEAACGRHESRQYAEAFNRPALLAEQRALHHVARARGINFINDLCTPHQCRTNLGNTWFYRDGEHLSVGGALALTGRFQHFIQMLARRQGTS